MRVQRRKPVVLALVFMLCLTITVLLFPNPGWGRAVREKELGKSSLIYYEVKKGDCLWGLANRFGIDLDRLADVNSLNKQDILALKQKLAIPVDADRAITVKEGTTLWDIAVKFGTVEEMVFQNLSDSKEKPKVEQVLAPLVPQLKLWPIDGTISSGFGPRNGRQHEGIDIAGVMGQPIQAVCSGVVVWADSRGNYGNTIIINHGQGFRSLYGHASVLEVYSGQYVTQGEVIARVGSTGRSTGPHVHLELLYKGNPVDPQMFLPQEKKL